MPRFDFECRECKKTFEYLLPAGAQPPPCLHCGSSNVQKRITPPPVIFKGSGFYKTDSRRERKTSEEPPKKQETASKQSTDATSAPPPSVTKEKADPKPKTP